MKSTVRAIKTHRASQSGQTVVEYILLLATVVIVILMIFAVLKPLFGKMTQSINKQVEDKLFKEENFHYFPLGH